jgi:glycerol-3-phosphate acyltransferase PlsY
LIETGIVIAAYLIGSLSFAVIVSRLFGLPDPHSYGSGNPGATNVLRTGKKLAAVLTLLGDSGKGYLAVLLGQTAALRYGTHPAAIPAVALACFAGHLWPIFFRFSGGKGVATAAGILLALDIRLGCAVLATWIVVVILARISSLAAIVAAIAAPLWYLYFRGADPGAAAVAVMALLLLHRHKANICRLLAGKEARIGRPQGT